MKRLFILALAATTFIYNATAWTGSIHSAIAAIAHQNLTESAKDGVAEYLGGHSIVHSASLTDSEANYIAITPKGKVLSAKRAAKSDDRKIAEAQLLVRLNSAIATVKGRNKATTEEVAAAIQTIIGAVADMHTPARYIYTAEPQLQQIYFLHTKDTKPRLLVTLWEGAAVTGTFGWKTNEFVHQLNRNSSEQIAAVTAGSVTDWIEGNAAAYRPLYDMVESGHHFEQSIDYRLWLNTVYPIALEQVAVAGYRLAALLNSLF